MLSTHRPDVLLTHPLFHVSAETFVDRYNFHKLWESINPSQLISQISNTCEVAVVRGPFSEKDMDKLPRLRLIAVCGVGYDGVDVLTAKSRNIQVTHTPDVLTEDVADLAFGLLLAAGRKIIQADKYVRGGFWAARGEMPYNRRVNGAKVGILGLGRIGLAIARRCRAFDMEIAYHNRSVRKDVDYSFYSKLTELAGWSDYLVVATPGGAETRHIVNSEVMSALGKNGILINIGRGSNIDQEALIGALKEGVIGGAALDVIDGEPEVPLELLELEDNLILQPHQASATFETRQAMVDLTLANVDAFYSNQSLLTLVPECK